MTRVDARIVKRLAAVLVAVALLPLAGGSIFGKEGGAATAVPEGGGSMAPLTLEIAQPTDPLAGMPTCGPISFEDTSDDPPPLEGPVADCVRPETDPGPDPIKKQAYPVMVEPTIAP